MQEDIDRKMVTFVVNGTKITSRILLKLIKMYLAHMKNKKNNPQIHQGKQTVKQLAKQNQGMTNIEITDENIKCFEKHARKYGVDFAIKGDKSVDPPKYLIFFKARDNDAIMSAFEEYSKSKIKQASRQSVLEKLDKQKEKIKDPVIPKIKNKELVR